jgi:hypothetical protein
MSSGEEQIIASQNISAAQALVVFPLLTANDEGRRAFKTAPEEAFNEYKAELDEPLRLAATDIPGKLASCSRSAFRLRDGRSSRPRRNIHRGRDVGRGAGRWQARFGGGRSR